MASSSNGSRVVAYTAAFGSHPLPHVQPIQPDVPLVCFTDRPGVRLEGYEVRCVAPRFSDPRLASRHIKVMGHEVFDNVDWAIWFDSEIVFKTGRLSALINAAGDASIAIHRHRVRSCVYVEAAVCREAGMDDPDRITAQMTRYQRSGYPRRAGLWESGLMVRRFAAAAVRQLNEAWWREIADGSLRDQLSLPIVLRQSAMKVAALPGFVFDSPFAALAPEPSSRSAFRPGSAAPGREGRSALATFDILRSGLFSRGFYRAQAGAEAGLRPLRHYLTAGWRRQLDPHPLFDVSFYLEAHADVASAGVEPLRHYVRRGGREGRTPHVLFDSDWYLRTNGADCRHWPGGPLGHYLTTGWRAGARPNRWFDPTDYLRRYPDVAASKVEPFSHFLWFGGREGRHA